MSLFDFWLKANCGLQIIEKDQMVYNLGIISSKRNSIEVNIESGVKINFSSLLLDLRFAKEFIKNNKAKR